MRSLVLRCLLIPLFAVLLAGTPAESGQLLEEESPVAAAANGFAVVRARLRRAASDRSELPAVLAALAKRFDFAFSLDRAAVAIAPHGRPDNTRGDPPAH